MSELRRKAVRIAAGVAFNVEDGDVGLFIEEYDAQMVRLAPEAAPEHVGRYEPECSCGYQGQGRDFDEARRDCRAPPDRGVQRECHPCPDHRGAGMSDTSLLKYKRYQDCPDAARLHSDPPRNMNQNGYSPTKKQVRCPTCGFWAMWVRKGDSLATLCGAECIALGLASFDNEDEVAPTTEEPER